MTLVSFEIKNDRLYIETPYDRDFISEVKKIGGRWDRDARMWHVDPREEEQARTLTRNIFGSDGTKQDEEDLVNVRITLSETFETYYENRLTIAGRTIAHRPGRDDEVKLGKDVILVSGGFTWSGGSRNNPVIGDTDAIVEVREFPYKLAKEMGLEIIDDSKTAKERLEQRKAELLAELKEIEATLKALD